MTRRLSNKQQIPRGQKPSGQVLMSHPGIPAVPRLVAYARVSTIEQSMDMQVTKLIEAGVDVDQYEREKIGDRTRHGMAEVKRQGQYLGRPNKLTDAQIERMKRDRKYMQPPQLAAKYGVSIATVNKYAPKRKT